MKMFRDGDSQPHSLRIFTTPAMQLNEKFRNCDSQSHSSWRFTLPTSLCILKGSEMVIRSQTPYGNIKHQSCHILEGAAMIKHISEWKNTPRQLYKSFAMVIHVHIRNGYSQNPQCNIMKRFAMAIDIHTLHEDLHCPKSYVHWKVFGGSQPDSLWKYRAPKPLYMKTCSDGQAHLWMNKQQFLVHHSKTIVK